MILASNGIIASQIALGPVATAATGVGTTSFTANWNTYTGAQYYLLDVSTSSSFSTFVYQDQVVLAPTTSYVVIGLTENTTYYYRLRASTDAVPITATGGTITYSGGRTIHTFTSSGTFTVLTLDLAAQVEALVVAGGGGGGSYVGGGGGAGGVIYNASKSISVTAYSITVGSGGAGAASTTSQGANGNNSVFDNLTAIGGGRSNIQTNGPNSGGSGGGGGALVYNGEAGTTGQGNAGGNSGTNIGGGGGGGANESGANGTPTYRGGKGGDGSAYSISGISTYYAGGGGGSSQTSPQISGGLGGGGNGNGTTSSTIPGENGISNTGGGGGGAWLSVGGNGGSGIVIISYPT